MHKRLRRDVSTRRGVSGMVYALPSTGRQTWSASPTCSPNPAPAAGVVAASPRPYSRSASCCGVAIARNAQQRLLWVHALWPTASLRAWRCQACSMPAHPCRKAVRNRPLCGEGEMWPITRPGAVQKPDAITVCNKGEGCATMATVQEGPGATFSGLLRASHGWGIRQLTPHARLCSHPVPVSQTHQLCTTETLVCETVF